MLFHVSASYLYKEEGQTFERSLSIVYECESNYAAIVAGIRWGLNRGEANGFGKPVCIKVHHYEIGRPEPSGYIKTGIASIFDLLEWKYDTSPLSIEQLLDQHEFYLTKEGSNGMGLQPECQ